MKQIFAFFRLSLWKKRIRDMLLQGVSVNKLSAAIVLGGVIGTFPVIGVHSLASVLTAGIFRLNQAVVVGLSVLVFPLLILLLYPYLLVGQWIAGASAADYTPVYEIFKKATEQVSVNPLRNIETMEMVITTLGTVFYHIVVGWIPVCCIGGFVCFFLVRIPISGISRRLKIDNSDSNSTLTK